MGDNWSREEAPDQFTRRPAVAPHHPHRDRSAASDYAPSSASPPTPSRVPSLRRILIAGLAVLALVALVGLLLHAPLAGLFAGHPPAAATPATTGPAVPAFSDWRAAYVGSDGHLHAVSLDGKADLDLSGTTPPRWPAPIDGSVEASQVSAGGSSSGHQLACADGLLAVIDLHAGSPYILTGIKDTATDVAWSPDGSLLAYGDRTGRVVIMHYPSLDEKVFPLADPSARVQPLGWRDASHAVVELAMPTGIQFEAIEIASGKVQPIATLPSAGLGTLFYSVSPDGSAILVSNSAQGQDHGHVSQYVKVIATATGQMRTLQSAATLAGNGITAAAWKPGSSLAAVAGGDPTQSGPKIQLLDTQHDTLRPLGVVGFPQTWTPDGTHLIATSTGNAQLGSSPHTIVAYSVPATGAPTAVTLTSSATMFPLLGLVRTA